MKYRNCDLKVRYESDHGGDSKIHTTDTNHHMLLQATIINFNSNFNFFYLYSQVPGYISVQLFTEVECMISHKRGQSWDFFKHEAW